jgi:hypothetical protein
VLNLTNRLRPDHWAWLHAKAAIILWAVLFFFFTPEKVHFALGWLLSTSVSIIVVGGILVSVIGLYVSLSGMSRAALRGINIELSGLWAAIGGMGAYFITQLFLAFGPEGDQRIALTAFAYAATAMLLTRVIVVREHRKRVTA